MNRKLLHLYFIGFTAVCTGLRLFLKFASVDPLTGYYEGYGAVVWLFNLLLLAGIGGCLLLGWLQPRRSYLPVSRIRRMAAVLVGVACFPAGVSGLAAQSGQLEMLQGAITMPALIAALVVTLVSFLCLGIAPFVTGGLFLMIARHTEDSQSRPIHGLLLLVPLAWQVALLLSSFMEYTAIRSVSDQMLTTVMLILLAPFLLAHARVLGQIDPDRGARQAVVFGLPFALVAFCACMGMLAASLAGRGVTVAPSPVFSAFYLFFGIYAAAFCLELTPVKG